MECAGRPDETVQRRLGAAVGAIAVILLLGGSSLRASPGPGPAVPPPTPAAPSREPVPTADAVPPAPVLLPRTASRPRPAPALIRGGDSARNEISNLRAESLSGQALQVTVDYAYAGDQGTEDVFLHAAALQRDLPNDGLHSRVAGTGFPGSAVRVGSGTITLIISKLVDSGFSTSTSIRVCLVSIPKRSAFLCRNFAHTKEWD